MPGRTCNVDDCDRPHLAKGLCKNHYQREHHAKHREARQQQQATYRAARRDENTSRAAAWRAANPERDRASTRRYAQEHRADLQKARARYRETNRDLIRALNNRRKVLLRDVAVNDLTGAQWRGIKAEWQGRCAYCGDAPPLLTMDHVQPLIRGGQHTAANVVPACPSCNSAKRDRPAPPFIDPPPRWAAAV